MTQQILKKNNRNRRFKQNTRENSRVKQANQRKADIEEFKRPILTVTQVNDPELDRTLRELRTMAQFDARKRDKLDRKTGAPKV